jgi:hypothetical protein
MQLPYRIDRNAFRAYTRIKDRVTRDLAVITPRAELELVPRKTLTPVSGTSLWNPPIFFYCNSAINSFVRITRSGFRAP